MESWEWQGSLQTKQEEKGQLRIPNPQARTIARLTAGSSHRQGMHCHLPREREGWGMGHF